MQQVFVHIIKLHFLLEVLILPHRQFFYNACLLGDNLVTI